MVIKKVKRLQITYALGASMGALLTGCCIGATVPHDHDIKEQASFADKDWGVGDFWVRACLPLSAMLFCRLSALNLLRRGPIVTSKIEAIVFFLAMVLYVTYFWHAEDRRDFMPLFLYRIFLGLGCSMATCAIPLLISEIAQSEIRGGLASLFYFYLTLGVLISYCSIVFLNNMMIYCLGLALALIFVAAVHLRPDSPLYLMKIKEDAVAIEAFELLRGSDFNFQKEFDSMKAMVNKSDNLTSANTFVVRITSTATLRAVFICVGLIFWQQFSGIHAVILTSVPTFTDTFDDLDRQSILVYVGIVQIFGAFLAIFLVDWAGRRVLLLISAAFMAVSMLALATCFTLNENGVAPFVFLIMFIFFFSIGFGPVPWIILGELFSLDVKENTISFVAGCFWLFHFINSDIYLFMKDSIGNNVEYLLWVFFCFLIFAFIFVLLFVPETKKKSLQEIEEESTKSKGFILKI